MLVLALVLAVNQAGYPAAAPKLAMVTGEPSPTGEGAAQRRVRGFSVLREGQIVFQAPLSAPQFDPNSGDRVQIADFSSIREPGHYQLRVDDARAEVDIATDPYADLRRLTTRAYEGQRCGAAVDLGNGYAHPACHLDSPALGGWHDAGDYGRYVVNSGISTATLMWAGALDEARWNVDWMLRMQDTDGSVWHKETSERFAEFVMPQDDHLPMHLIGKSTCAAADFAAVMAIASGIYRDDRYASAAKRAWAWTATHPNVTFSNPPDVETGEYGDSDCSDERLWAAAELWRATGDADAHAYFLAHAQQAVDAIRPDRPPDWKHVGALAAWTYALSENDDLAARIRKRSIKAADAIVARTAKNPYRIPMLPANFEWGSNAVAANYAMQLLVADKIHHHNVYRFAALDILHYLLGRNAFATSWVTGVGTKSVMHPHHRPSIADGIVARWPGLLAGGPNRNRQDPVLRKLPPNVAPAKAWIDDQRSFSGNEVAINWNAPLVYLLAAIAKPKVALFRAPNFPTVDAPPISDATLNAALKGFDVVPFDRLREARALVLPYGSAFPVNAWPEIRDFIHRGGDLVVLGGAPFHQPVPGERTPKFARELLIGPAEAVRVGSTTVWELTLRLGSQAMAADEGSQAYRDAIVHPLAHLVDANGIPRACPIIEIDRIRGTNAGARWIFATSDAPLAAKTIHDIVARALEGASQPVKAKFIYDPAALEKLPKIHLTVSRDWMRRDDKVFPVIGTTYMASDVHREFLFEPNPELWNRDFALMQRLGINFVRTGLWTGWSRVDESALRALDMYIAAAARHNIVVCFTFFAFLPPAYGGTNPYLDPKSIERQEEFITRIARRYKGIGWVQYDLINEPSYAPPNKLWNTVPIGDSREEGGGSRYDFILFTQGAVERWAAHMRDVIRSIAGDALVTLGQDEGGTQTRSSQQLHADAVDYTSMHPWWNNADVLSSGVFAKVPEKPMLFEEVGLMRLEDKDGWPVRSPEVSAQMVERKFAYAFAARGTGAVEWAWNINPYMPADNESVIGFWRPDGTAKPELDVVPKYAKFFREAAPWLDDFAPDPVVVVIPESHILKEEPGAIDAFRKIIHLMAERFGIVPTAIADLRLTSDRVRNARLVITPPDENFSQQLAAAGVATNPGADGVVARVLEAPRAFFAIFVNETASDAQRTISIDGRPMTVSIPAGRSRLMLFDKTTGSVVADSEITGRR
ncbi:MAG TPA: glycoside hydrolase family 9 protein [Thermoanaerobaculia bacterium]|nr:glycoside hydrolase family 9 protein [Thermoanaerobaculia bacterium]